MHPDTVLCLENTMLHERIMTCMDMVGDQERST